MLISIDVSSEKHLTIILVQMQFTDCHLLEKINIPVNCYHLGNNVFFNCYNLSQIDYSGTKDQLIKNGLYKQLIGDGFYINKVNCVDGVFEIK